MSILALYSNKGGVGKTAAAVNLAYLAAAQGWRTLICDLDPQGATTFYFRVKPKLPVSAKKYISGGKAVHKSIKATDFENLDLLPAAFSLRHLDITISDMKRSRRRLEKMLSPLRDDYDLLILDSPPTINLLAENIFVAADAVLVPVIPTTLSYRTYEQLLAFFKKRRYSRKKVFAFFSMVDRRKTMHRDTQTTMRASENGLLQTTIPYLSAVEKMGTERQPIFGYSPRSAAAKAYRSLWQELTEKVPALKNGPSDE